MTVTRQVHKKVSPNGKLTLILVKREILSHVSHVEPIEGIVVYSDEIAKSKIHGQVIVTFRYGREEDEILGLNFSKELFLISQEIYPDGSTISPSKLQSKLINKYGPNVIPFTFKLNNNTPQTVVIQPEEGSEGQPCGVYYKVRVFVEDEDGNKSKPDKRQTVEMAIRKIEVAPGGKGRQPSCIIRKDFLLSPGELELEATLDKPLYYHGENLNVNLSISNYSNKSVKKIVLLVLQHIDVAMFTSGNYSSSLVSIESQEGCPINPGSTLSKTFVIKPKLDSSSGRGIAIECALPGEDQKLATSTLLTSDQTREDVFGIQVSYC
ncbi:arrestin homolog isoform X2 [Panonychus citri]|nr:arrestin homolog isoform X2 [Panonychus citri]